jgi:nicotinamide mononucleotide transporter
VTNPLEMAAVITGAVAVYLSVRQKIWSWPVGLLNAALYFVVFYRTGLYSDMGLQVVYFVLSLYGWYEWLYGGEGRTELTVSHATPRHWVILLGLGVVAWYALGAITSRLPGAALPYLDAATVATSLLAQWMMTRKLLENWLVWIAVDVVYVGMFVFKKLYLTAGLYALFLGLAVMGYVQWRRTIPERALHQSQSD